MGPFFTILAGLQLLAALYAYLVIQSKRRASYGRQQTAAADLALVKVEAAAAAAEP